MTDNDDIRWKQRFANYKKAVAILTDDVYLIKSRKLSNLERSGFIQDFEFVQELSWNVLKDYLEYQGITGITGSRDAYRKALNRNLITNGEIWMDIIKSRNLSSHTYDESQADKLVSDVINTYLSCFIALKETLDGIIENSAE